MDRWVREEGRGLFGAILGEVLLFISFLSFLFHYVLFSVITSPRCAVLVSPPPMSPNPSRIPPVIFVVFV